MAIRSEELLYRPSDAVVYRFPCARTAGMRRQAMLRRRRNTLGALVVAVAAALLIAGGSTAAPDPAAPVRHRTVVVQPGDTLWGIAQRHVIAQEDPRAYVNELIALNDLDEPVQAGQRLLLP